MIEQSSCVLTRGFPSREIRAFKKKKKKKQLSRLLLGSPRCFFNNYSVHCCAHITLRPAAHTRQTAEFVAIAVVFSSQIRFYRDRNCSCPGEFVSRLRV